jgi:prophage tail gpP-like protein
MSDSNFIATVEANGFIYSAWESVMVRREFKDPISVFEFTPTEGAYGQNYSQLALMPGDSVTISLGGEQVINGSVTTRNVAYDSKSHQIVIAGKSKTLHLAKASVVVKPGTYDGYTFQQAAQAVMAPHPVQLMMTNPPASASKPFANLAVQYGETVAEFIERISMMRGLHLWDDKDGNLVAGQGGQGGTAADLAEGVNILSANARIDNQSAWGPYASVGQQPGNDNNWPPRAISASGTNPNYPQNWYKLWHAEHPGDAEDMASRVNMEMAIDAGAHVNVTVTVVGWKKPSGSLWDILETVTILSPMIFGPQSSGLTLGVQSVVYEQDSANGTTTTLNLCLPQHLRSIPTAGVQDAPPGIPGQGATAATPDQPDWKSGAAN